jgi:glycosyltransferase involved in cell wall biosynthesis
VAAGGRRDSYQVPIAFHEWQQLGSLVTDFYAPLDKPLVNALSKLLPAGKLFKRYSPDLPSQFVKSVPGTLLKNMLGAGWMEYNHTLGEYAGKLAAERQCGIVSYAHLATSAFGKVGSQPKVLIQMQPHPASVRAALSSDELLPEWKEPDLMNELRWPQTTFDKLSREPLLADTCIVMSNYTRRTLIENNVSPQRIAVVPYGVDLDFFSPVGLPPKSFTVLFVGQPVRQKGFHYLLESWHQLRLPNSELRVAGGQGGTALTLRYGSQCRFLGKLNWYRLRDEYRQADLLCLPSLSEGFGLVTLESLACGTPVLASQAAGSSELLDDGEDGFVIPTANLNALMAALESAYSDRRRLREMRAAARRKAERFPWSKFRDGIRGAVFSSERAGLLAHE